MVSPFSTSDAASGEKVPARAVTYPLRRAGAAAWSSRNRATPPTDACGFVAYSCTSSATSAARRLRRPAVDTPVHVDHAHAVHLLVAGVAVARARIQVRLQARVPRQGRAAFGIAPRSERVEAHRCVCVHRLAPVRQHRRSRALRVGQEVLPTDPVVAAATRLDHQQRTEVALHLHLHVRVTQRRLLTAFRRIAAAKRVSFVEYMETFF